ncbi:TolB family protein [Candidatus Palauibacter sp.]|uniref:TolB family protein n=1 Tax=Candidatus Palauibacter sp. TaxID=3101350 RepID=UPI003B5A2A84
MNSRYDGSAPTRALPALMAALGVAACADEAGPEIGGVSRDPLPEERRFASLSQLTFAGENAEAYFSSDGERLIFQRRHEGEYECDQIFTIGTEGGERNLVSTGLGRTTCAYFFPDDSRILYSSTHHAGGECPPPPDMRRGYVWALYDFDIYTARPDGSDVQVLFRTPGYDAEATIAPDGSRIVFTSTRDGDLDIYSMNPDGSDVVNLTDEPGYDGGPFFSPDGSKIVYRARYPEDPEELADYQALLADNLVRPGVLDIYVMDADGSNRVRLTNNAAANFAPFFHPNGEQVIFASNLHDPDSRNFDLFLINLDGTGLEQVTFSEEFESFPMFTPDGRYLVFASNRHGSHEGNTNLFIAAWIDELPE